MKKSELVPKLCDLLNPLLTEYGYRYLKSHEKYQKKTNALRLWLFPNITYWSSSNYCMIAPRISVHVDVIEYVIAKHAKRKVDRHSPTLTIISDKLDGGSFWSIKSLQEFEQKSKEIVDTLKMVNLPLLENWSTPRFVALTAMNNELQIFHSELHRLMVLFAYTVAFRDPDILSRTIRSVDIDSIYRSRCQTDVYYRQVLKSMMSDVPEIGELEIDL